MKKPNLLSRILSKSREHGDFLNQLESASKGDKKSQQELDKRQLASIKKYGSSNQRRIVSGAYKKRVNSKYYDQGSTTTDSITPKKNTLLSKMIKEGTHKLSKLKFNRPKTGLNFNEPQTRPIINHTPKFNTTTATRPITPDSSQHQQNSYQVKTGDSLGVIAARNGISLDDIKRYNPNIQDINSIDVGQQINLGSYNAGNSGAQAKSNQSRTVDQIFAETAGAVDPIFVGPMPLNNNNNNNGGNNGVTR